MSAPDDTDADVTATWLADFVAAESQPERVDGWVARVAGAVLAETPELAHDTDLVELALATVREQWQTFLRGLDQPRTQPALLPSAVDLAAELARRHYELPVLLSAYRSAQREAWAYAIDVTRSAPAEVDRATVLVDLWSRAGDWLDHATSASILVHQDERRRIRRSGTAQRFELVRALLDGSDPDSRELTLALGGYPIQGPHTAVILRAETLVAMSRLEPTAHALATAAGSARPLLVEPGGRELWLWLPSEAGRVPSDFAVPASMLIAVGGSAEGAAGFRTTHEEAHAALGLIASRPGASAVTHYDQVASLTFLARDPAAADRFVRRILGPLADDRPGRDRLRETVLVLLGSTGVDEAAGRLGVHKNTVRYRLTHAEELLGHPLSERRGDVELALRYLAAFPAG